MSKSAKTCVHQKFKTGHTIKLVLTGTGSCTQVLVSATCILYRANVYSVASTKFVMALWVLSFPKGKKSQSALFCR
jgi:hypothetical protein